MYALIRLFGNHEEQKKTHRILRRPIIDLQKAGIISRFVLTYHRESLYLCLDSNEISDCTLEAISQSEAIKPIIDCLGSFWQNNKVSAKDYEIEVQNSIRNNLTKVGFENPSDLFVLELSKREIDNASRGSAAALRILTEGPQGFTNCSSLCTKIYEYCKPLNAGWFLSDSLHFCVNSMAIKPEEEDAIRRMGLYSMILYNMMNRLFARESWKNA